MCLLRRILITGTFVFLWLPIFAGETGCTVDYINFNTDILAESELIRLIEYHNKCYWENGEPEISDERYDELIRALRKTNPGHPLLSFVGAQKVAGSGKVVHRKPMLSLDKAYSYNEVLTWATKYARNGDEIFLIQPKYDGISANYSENILATRGDGEAGENITDKLPLIELETIGYRGPVNRPVRGEIVIRDDDFAKIYANITKKGGGSYKNSRNAVAGIMGLKDISDMVRQKAKLTLVDYNLVSYSVLFEDLQKESTWGELVAKIEELPYPLDGIVIKLADESYSESLGTTAHHPRGQIAFKFSGIRRESKILNVKWSFGKNCLTPVAEIEPVDIGGITIRNATLHNAQNIEDRDIFIGDTVIVERAGDVIPYIVEARPGENRRSAMIVDCPCCGSRLERRGPDLSCTNPECSETKVQRLYAAVRNIGIERLGEPNIRRLISVVGVRSLKDIFALKLEDILKLEGFKTKSATNLMDEIAKARMVTDYQLLAALNIPNVGPNIAKLILTEHTLDELRRLDAAELSKINGIGPERAIAVERELRLQSSLLDDLLEAVTVRNTKGSENGNLPKICFTGKMPEKRSFYHALAQERGYEPVEDVNSALSLLVADNPDSSSSKLEKARKAGIKIVSLEEWIGTTTQIPGTDSKKNKTEQLELGF